MGAKAPFNMKFTDLSEITQARLKKQGINNLQELRRVWFRNIRISKNGQRISYLSGCGKQTVETLDKHFKR